MESKKISNDQELIQSDPTSCPINQKEYALSQNCWNLVRLFICNKNVKDQGVKIKKKYKFTLSDEEFPLAKRNAF